MPIRQRELGQLELSRSAQRLKLVPEREQMQCLSQLHSWFELSFLGLLTQAGRLGLTFGLASGRSPFGSNPGMEDSSTGDTTLLVRELTELSHVMIGASRFTALKRILIRPGLNGKS